MTFTTKIAHSLDLERSIHSLKTALACLIGFVLTRFTRLPVDQWLIITIIVVMTAQINVGSMLQKSYMRFLGTLIGSIIAAITLEFFGNHFLSSASVIVISILFFSYLATGASNIREAGTLGAVTVVIILVGNNPTLWTAVERFLEISGGIFIAALVSQFILPIHARAHLRRSQTETIKQLCDYYRAAFIAHEGDSHEKIMQNLEPPIVKSITNQRTLAQMAKREPFGEKFHSDHFTQFLQCEIEILRSIDFMHYAYDRNGITRSFLNKIPLVNELHNQVMVVMEKIEEIINDPNKKVQGLFIPSLIPLKNETEKLGSSLTSEERAIIDAFLFCAEILVEQLKKLVGLYQIENLDEIKESR